MNATAENHDGGIALQTEILLLPDGRLFVHNLTPVFARLLSGLAPNDPLMNERADSPHEHSADSPPRTE